jgi:transcriptional regulator with XRE-family HTH domain
MTQKELARITGIDQAVISKIENGAREPGIRTLERLANGLGYTFKLVPKK